jgi:uncharacterized OsmC-like protein
MNADELRAMQAPLKATYRENPGAAKVTLHARVALGADQISCKVETGLGKVEAGLHPATGGDGSLACSGDMLLEALAACAGVTLKAVSTALGIVLRSAAVVADGEVDFRGTLGVSKETPVGFESIRLRFELDTDASPEQVAQLLKLTERYCVVFQTLAKPPQVAMSHRVGAT